MQMQFHQEKRFYKIIILDLYKFPLCATKCARTDRQTDTLVIKALFSHIHFWAPLSAFASTSSFLLRQFGEAVLKAQVIAATHLGNLK